MKKRLSSFLSLIFVFIVAFVFVGCAGPENLDELDEMLENGELSEEEYYDQLEQAAASIPLDGVLVLRKPSEYDFINNVIESNYYASFSEDVMTYLFIAYGAFNSLEFAMPNNYGNMFEYIYTESQISGIQVEENEVFEEILNLSNQFETNPDSFLGFYDAIRAQVTNVNQIRWTYTGTDGTITLVESDVIFKYIYDSNTGDLTLTDSFDNPRYTGTDGVIEIEGVLHYYRMDGNTLLITTQETAGVQIVSDMGYGWNWSLPYDASQYQTIYLATGGSYNPVYNTVTTEILNEQYTNTYFSEYYTGNNGDLFFDTNFYLSSFANSEYATALEYAIYRMAIGLRPAEMSVKYDSVTGQPTVNVEGFAPQGGAEPKTSVQVALEKAKEEFYELGTYVGLTSTTKENIVNFILDEIIGERAQSTQLAQDTLQYEVITRAIVEYTGTLTTVGQTMPDEEDPEAPTDDNPTYVGDTFTASEAVLFPYSTFFSAASNDNPFVNVGGPYEYQSFVILPSNNDYEIGDIWLDMKYDAGNDGDEIVTDETLDMTIYVRWVQVQTDAEGNVLSRNVRQLSQHVSIPDGPYRAGYDGWFVEFELDVPSGFGETVKLGEFPVPEELTPDKSENASNRVVTITGLTDARKYYEVLESSYNSASTYAVLDSEQFNCSYFEVAFDVEKEPGNLTKNYAFYCSILNLFEPPSWPNDPVWH